MHPKIILYVKYRYPTANYTLGVIISHGGPIYTAWIWYWYEPKETSMFGWIWQNCFAGTTGAGPNPSNFSTAASIVQFRGSWSIAFVCFLLHKGQWYTLLFRNWNTDTLIADNICQFWSSNSVEAFQSFLFFLKLITHCLQNEWPQSSDNIGDFIVSVQTGHSNKSGSIAKNIS